MTATNTPARRVDVRQPVQDLSTLQSILSSRADNLAQVLPKHLTPDRLIKLVMVAANRTPKLLQCKGMTIIESVMRAAELGLDCSGTLGEAYLVPYGQDCTLIPGFRGLAKLARQSGEVKRIEAEIVYEHDDFVYEKGVKFNLRHAPNLHGDRGEVLGAYALVEFKDGGVQAEFMSVSDIEAIRNMSKAGRSGPWVDHWHEMARKTVFRRLAKWLPLSSEKFDQAIGLVDQEFQFSLPQQTQAPGGAAALNAAINNAAEQADAQHQEQPAADEAIEPDAKPAPLTWIATVDALKAVCGCDTDTAEQVIADEVTKKWKIDVAEMTPKQIETVIKAVEDGKITA